MRRRRRDGNGEGFSRKGTGYCEMKLTEHPVTGEPLFLIQANAVLDSVYAEEFLACAADLVEAMLDAQQRELP